jgi:hypothetical protein
MLMKGSIDKLTATGAVGWLYAPGMVEKPVVEAVLDGTVIGRSAAELYRPDLERVGFGDGRCGFEMSFQHPIEPEHLPFVAFRPDDSTLLLPMTSPSGFIELASSIIRAFPAAGRHRTILGGLWTDRTDAIKLLESRIAVGSCAAELKPMLQEIILHGYVVLQGALSPNGLSENALLEMEPALSSARGEKATGEIKAALSSLASAVFREPVVKLLRAIFDDFPVMYRLDFLRHLPRFTQASGIELLPSPAECLLLYFGSEKSPVQIELVRNSHELPELGSSGLSRWTPAGAGVFADLACPVGLSVEVLEIGPLDLVVVGPGLIHRIRQQQRIPLIRALCAPKRLTPLRFLAGEDGWVEVRHASGAAIRI